MIELSTIQSAKAFECKMFELLDMPIALEIERFKVSSSLCLISFDHWLAVKNLLESQLYPSAITLMRSQYEALVKSVWSHICATNDTIEKLYRDLDKESEQAAKNLPGLNEIMKDIKKSAHPNIANPLSEIKTHSWNAFNSFTHSGIHAISRFRNGFPSDLADICYRQANGIALLTGMQYVLLCGAQQLQNELIKISIEHNSCMPKVANTSQTQQPRA